MTRIRTAFALILVALTSLGTDCYQCATSPVSPGVWRVGAPLPERLQEIQGAALGTSIIVAGGFDSTNTASPRAYRYDIMSNSWTRIADLPAARHHMPLVTAGDSVYAVGGYTDGAFNASTTLWVYRPDSNLWSPRAPLPQPRGASVAAATRLLDTVRIVVVGGLSGPAGPVDSVDIYYPGTNSWRRGKPILTPRDHLGGGILSANIGPVFVAAGGRLPNPMTVTEGYTLLTNGWHMLSAMPTARGGVGSATTDETLHVLGGEDAVSHSSHFVYTYHSNTWLTLEPMPTARHGLAVVQAGGLIYAIGGGPTPGFSQTAVVEVYTPAQPSLGSCY